MSVETPDQQPEGALLYDAQQASGRSIKTVAKQAGLSDARWRQIIKGSMHVQGTQVPVVANPHTLARMAIAVGVTPDQLREVGREDAALAMEHFDQVDNEPQEPAKSRAGGTGINEQIELIYASTSMTAQQKLDAIAMVLRLQAQVDAGTAQGSGTAYNANTTGTPVGADEN